jgi:formylglycine-generating enzyme required for sulfatase activity
MTPALLLALSFLSAAQPAATSPPSTPEAKPAPKAEPAPIAEVTVNGQKVGAFKQEIPGAAFAVEMVPIPGDEKKAIAPFYMARLETVWDAYDTFVFAKDEDAGLPPLGADVMTRPSRPYIPPDSGFGHAGYAVICPTFRSVTEYCKWLSARTGRQFRLATEAEWEHAAAAGSTTTYHFGDDAKSLGDYAWFKDNSDESPHPPGSKKPNAWGLFDMHGNVSEWVTAADTKKVGGVAKGGSWESEASDVSSKSRAEYDIKWQKIDPQIPKSKWWMSDGQHVGFRLVAEMDPKTGAPLETAKKQQETPAATAKPAEPASAPAR